MADETKKGILSRLLGVKNSGGCNIKIEEVTEVKLEALENKKQDKIGKASERNS
ncbi:MAG: hypothetical protein MZV70_74850 [Desulfobacterales bacterium]|nr:hypothetical protein [Desulfobacterales bacterium]